MKDSPVDQERLPFVNKNRKFRLETQMVQLIPPESFWKRWKSSEVFLFSRSNRNDRKNPVPFVNSHSTRCTSASFPAIRRCRCSPHLFSSSRESLGLGETPHRENPVPLRAFHSNRIFRANGKRPKILDTFSGHCLAQIYSRLIILPQVFSPPRK